MSFNFFPLRKDLLWESHLLQALALLSDLEERTKGPLSQLASLAAQETGLCFLRLEKWTKTKAVEVGRNPHQGI